jgi:hypothetical protein
MKKMIVIAALLVASQATAGNWNDIPGTGPLYNQPNPMDNELIPNP